MGNLSLPLFVSFLGVTLDLLTSTIGLKLGYAETRMFGNIAAVEYSVFLGFTLLAYVASEWLPMKVPSKRELIYFLGKGAMIVVALLPYYAVIHNILVMGT